MIGVGVGGEQGDPVRKEGMHDRPLVIRGRDRVHAPQEEGVMRDDQVGLEEQRLIDHREHRVDREEDPADGRVGITADESDGIPVGGQRGRVTRFEDGDDVAEAGSCGHGRQATQMGAARRDVGSLRVGP
jgi:hypothetical protein